MVECFRVGGMEMNRSHLAPVLLLAAAMFAWSTPARAAEDQCPPEVMDCGCGTDPSCPGVDLSAYYIDPTCDPETDASCDQIAGGIAVEAYSRCGSVAKTAGFRLCFWSCRQTYMDTQDTCDSWIMYIGGGRLACHSEAARTYETCVSQCAIDYCS
jgi:hypothetical protein